MPLRPLYATEVLLLLNSLLMRGKLDELLYILLHTFLSCHVVEFLKSLVARWWFSEARLLIALSLFL